MKTKINWNKVWDSEKDNDYWKIPDPDFVKFINTHPGKLKSVMDLGCGIGRHSIFLAKQGFYVTALDVSVNAINYLIEWSEQENVNITTIVGDIFSNKIINQRFDLIVSINVIYHARRNEIKRIIKGIHNKLTQQDLLYLTFLTRDDDKYGIGKEIEPHTFLCDTSIHEGDIHYFADEEDLRDLFKDFDIISLNKDETQWKHKGIKRSSSFWKFYCKPINK